MHHMIQVLTIGIFVLPLVGALFAGLLGHKIGRKGAHTITITLVGLAFACALGLNYLYFFKGAADYQFVLYDWAVSGRVGAFGHAFQFEVGFLLDHLSVLMLMFVTFVSFMVHIYSMGYMREDLGYQRFFSYVSLFTFAMIILVLADNFMLLFFGWEGVGLVSYLLIGFWFNKDTAVAGSFKAFIANRVGDMGFLVGIAAVFMYFGTLNYSTVFEHAPQLANATVTLIPGIHWSVMTVICIGLLIGAMGKSAQMPLHVWLPESMEGPTPISALIHAATMVTAGIYMIARMSPLFELSATALSTILVIGASTCLFMGIIGVVQHDVKRVIAYSTLSQLGYMMAALGASAYSAGVFHLFTHACFKALLFLAAGSVIVAMHHEQDMRKMGGLRRYMPITYVTFLIGALALSAIPPFAGFFSKDAIIEAVGLSTLPGAGYAYVCVLGGAFVTALYIFRAFFLTFHTSEKMDPKIRQHLTESSWSITFPLVCLAIPSAALGALMVGPILYNHLLGNAIYVLPQYNVLGTMAQSFHGADAMMSHAFKTLPFWFAISGIVTAWLFNVKCPHWSEWLKTRFSVVYKIIVAKYGFDDFNQIVLARGSLKMAKVFFHQGDERFLDHALVNGVGRMINFFAIASRKLQTGYLYHYAFSMVLGLFVFFGWYLLG